MVGVCPPKDMSLFAAQGASRKPFPADEHFNFDERKTCDCCLIESAKVQQNLGYER